VSYSKTILMGNLGADPELRFTPGGDAVCSASLATSEKWADKQGRQQERTQWHRLVIWGKRGEAAGKYWNKGMMVHVEGVIQYEQWTDKDGVVKYSTKIKVSSWEFCGSKADNQGTNRDQPGPGQDPAGPYGPQYPAQSSASLPYGDIMAEDGLPF